MLNSMKQLNYNFIFSDIKYNYSYYYDSKEFNYFYLQEPFIYNIEFLILLIKLKKIVLLMYNNII